MGIVRYHMGLIMFEAGLMILLVIVANAACTTKVLRKTGEAVKSRDACVRATVTVIILSCCFCVMNGAWLSAMIMTVFVPGFQQLNANFFLYVGLLYAVPLNSALNPLIYFVRKREMRIFLWDCVTCKARREGMNSPQFSKRSRDPRSASSRVCRGPGSSYRANSRNGSTA